MDKKGDKIVLSDGMLPIAIDWFHDKLQNPKYIELIKSLKYH